VLRIDGLMSHAVALRRLVMFTGHMKTISASEFKARCLAILDQVSERGETVTILKRGRPVAELVPPTRRRGGAPQDTLRGTVEFIGDVVAPAVDSDEWEANR
jgi:prevent-host-death family protein